jgi:hypothetical protein
MTAVTSPAPRSAWHSLFAADRDAVLCQAPEWTDVLCAAGYADRSRLYELGDGRRLLLPLVGRRGVSASMPEAWGMGGVLADGPLRPDDLAFVGRDLASLPSVRVAVRPNPVHAGVWQAAGGRPVRRRAHVLDLGGGPDTVFSQRFSSDARRSVRKAERAGLEIRCGSDKRLLADYRRLFDLSVARWAAASHEPLALARLRANRRDPRAKFERLAAAFPTRLRVWLAYDGEAPVAGVVVLLAAAASYTRGAMDRDRITASSANELLHWLAIQDACAAGCRTYHLGDSGSSVSLARFKEKLGARPVVYAERRFERLPLTRAEALARGTVKRIVGFRDA